MARSDGDSGYYHYPAADLVARQETYSTEVEVGRRRSRLHARAARPAGTRLSSGTLTVPTFAPGFMRPDLSAATLTVYWAGQPDALYYVTVESTDASATPVDTASRFFGRRRLVFSPTPADSFTVSAFALTHYGPHRVRVYRVNEEYAQLYATLQQRFALTSTSR
jgi:hypothetical protein